MDKSNETPVVVIGCGRDHFSDDAVGLRVAERIAGLNPPFTRVVATETGLDVVVSGADAKLLIVIDAGRSGGAVPVGTCRRLDYHSEPHRLVVRDPGNAHTIGVDAALELSRLLGLLPARVWVYAIAVEDRGTGDGLSPDAMRAVHEVAARVARDIDAWLSNTAVVPDGSACEGAVCTS